MPNEQLKTYILSQIRAGLSNQDITTQLQQAGWDDATIIAAFREVSDSVAPAFIPAQQPTPAEDTANLTIDDPQLSALESEPSTEKPVQSSIASVAVSAAQTTTASEKVALPPPLQKGKLKTGWLLFKQSFRIIRNNPILYRYVIFSILSSIVLCIAFVAILIIDSMNAKLLTTEPVNPEDGSDLTFAGYGIGIVYLFFNTAVTYFFATALSAHVLTIFKGTVSTVSENLTLARKKLPAIVTYALISTVIGFILSIIERRFKLLGRLISYFLNTAWSLATTFTLPVIADTNTGGIPAIKESMRLFKDNWGQTIVGRVSISGAVLLVYLLVMIPVTIMLAFMLTIAFEWIGLLIAFGIFVFSLINLIIIKILVTNVLNVSLYYYAKYNAIPPSFDPQLLASAFVAKKPKK